MCSAELSRLLKVQRRQPGTLDEVARLHLQCFGKDTGQLVGESDAKTGDFSRRLMPVSREKALQAGNRAVAAGLSADCRDVDWNLLHLVTNELGRDRKSCRFTPRDGRCWARTRSL